ncbi:MAG: primosomal protein N' [Candidatus Omnitrophica bacterium]|nr:primosomal protein N' [Candidatus Omnitrophota bacterium]
MSKTVAQVVFSLPIEGHFDYSVDDKLKSAIYPGQRVKVVFNKRKIIGYILKLSNKSQIQDLNPVIEVLDKGRILSDGELAFAGEFSRYYGCSLGEAIECFLPVALRGAAKTLSVVKEPVYNPGVKPKATVLNMPDKEAGFKYLLERIKTYTDDKKGILIIVPESAQVKRLTEVIKKAIDAPILSLERPLVMKSDISKWEAIKNGDTGIVVGTRSSVFSPLYKLGLIVMFHECNYSYRQEQSPHYHTRDVCLMRSKLSGCDLIFAGEAFSAEVWNMKNKFKWEYKDFPREKYADLQIVDMENYGPKTNYYLSYPLQNAISKSLAENKKALLFFNRKGFNSRTQCSQCGYTLKCERCDTWLTFIYSAQSLACPRCGFKCELPKICPKCEKSYLKSSGMGIEKLESDLMRFFPQAKICCFDKDSKNFNPDANIIIATSAILKKADTLNIDIAACINLDSELNRPDYRSAEGAFFLLIALRNLAKEKLIVQTRLPDNYSLRSLKKLDFNAFYKEELKLRKELGFPPYKDMVVVTLRAADKKKAEESAEELYKALIEKKPKNIEIIEPQPSIVPKLRDKFRYSIMLKGRSPDKLISYLKDCQKRQKNKHSVVTTIEVNP